MPAPTPADPKLIALDVAEAFLAESPSPTRDAQLIHQTALLIGQHVADLGHAGEWRHLRGERFFQQLGFMDEAELVPLSLTVIALFAWLGSQNLVSPAECKRIFREVVSHGPKVSSLGSLATSGEKLLDTASVRTTDSLQIC